MILTLTAKDNSKGHPAFDAMFRARAEVFHDRLGWAVCVKDGYEIDKYDREADPVYLVSQDAVGEFTGSLRLLPTTGETMLRNDFGQMFNDDVDIASPTAWECTRFCLHPSAHPIAKKYAATDLLHGLCKLALSSGIEHIIGVYGAEMEVVYRRLGWSPEPISKSKPQFGSLYVGLWTASSDNLEKLRLKLEARGASLTRMTEFAPAMSQKPSDNSAPLFLEA
jgi:acyl homoserine lactone synthase